MDNIQKNCASLPPHGRMTCDKCWKNTSSNVQEAGSFRLVRDPGHWGSSTPSTLVLGVSKGNTQSNAFATAPFEDVAFKGIRHRLLEVLQTVGLLEGETVSKFERRFQVAEREYAFASVVRCSLTGMDRDKKTHTADSPNVIPAFKAGSAGFDFVASCVDQHIGRLSSVTRRVILLGNAPNYVKHVQALIGHSRGGLVSINDVAYKAGGVLFVHVSHPSKRNGHFGAFTRGEGTSGMKMHLARHAITAG